MQNIIFDIIDSYDKRIEIVNNIIEGSHELLSNYRIEREEATLELRETLAKSGSLRRKDFDAMMLSIQQNNNLYEKTVKAKLKLFVKDHHNVSTELRNVISTASDNNKTNSKAPNNFLKRLEKIKQHQNEQEKELHSLLNTYQENHDDFLDVVGDLIQKGSQIKFIDVKKAMHLHTQKFDKHFILFNYQKHGGNHAN